MARYPLTEEERTIEERVFWEKKIPYIVDTARKVNTYEVATHIMRSNSRNVARQLAETLQNFRNQKFDEFAYTILSVATMKGDDVYRRGVRNRLLDGMLDAELENAEIQRYHLWAKQLNRDLRIISDYWALCGYTFPTKLEDISTLVTEMR